MVLRELVTNLGFNVDFGPLNKFDDKIGETKEGLEGMGAAADDAVQQVKSALVTIRNTLIGFSLATAAGAAGLVAMVKSAANVGDEINKMAPMLGFSVEEFQKYRYAAKLAGVENENFAASTQLLLRNIAEANNGNKEIGKSFARAGLNPAALKGLSTDQVLRKLSDGLAAIPDEATRVSVSMDLLGRSGARMGMFLARGTAEMDALMGDVEAFGMFTKESAQNAEDMNDAWDRVGFFIRGMKNEFMGLFPVFTGILNEFRQWLTAHREIIKAGLAKAVEILGAVITRTWTIVKRVVHGFETMIRAMGGLENAFYLLAISIISPLMLLLGPVVLLTKATFFLLVPFIRLHTLISLVTFAISAMLPLWSILISVVSALAATKIIGWLVQLAGGYRAIAAAMAIPTLMFIAQAAALAFLILLFEDLTVWIKGGKSLIGEWVGEWELVPKKLQTVWAMIKETFRAGGKFIAAVFRGDFAEAYRILDEGAGKVKAAMPANSETDAGLRAAQRSGKFFQGAGGFGVMAPSATGVQPFSMAGGNAGPSGVGNGPGFARAFRQGDVMDMQGNFVGKGGGGPRVANNVKIDLSLTLPKGTPAEHAEQTLKIVDDRLRQHIDHSLQQSAPAGG